MSNRPWRFLTEYELARDYATRNWMFVDGDPTSQTSRVFAHRRDTSKYPYRPPVRVDHMIGEFL